MKADREQVLLGAIDILTHPELPFELSGTKLYGKTKTEREETDMDADTTCSAPEPLPPLSW